MELKKHIVGEADAVEDGGMKAFEIDEDHKILIARVKGEYYAMGATCPHYGAPLEDGILSGNRVLCPWHHSAFDIQTGDLLEPPAMDNIPVYEVNIENGNIVVMLPDKIESSVKPEMSEPDSDQDERTFVIVGAGAAGNTAAQTLRETGFKGKIKLVTKEKEIPYDRPELSKEFMQGKGKEEWLPLRSKDFYENNGIDLMFETEVTKVDTAKHEIDLGNGDRLKFDRILLATGGRPRRLDIPGNDLDNVFTLRSHTDASRIIASAEKAKKAVVVGANFIGMETANSLRERGLEVTVVAPEDIPMKKIFGDRIGTMFRRAHEDKGVKFMMGHTVEKFEGDGTVRTAILDNSEKLEADLVVIGIGVVPSSDTIDGIAYQPDGSIEVDEHMNSKDNIYAAGDIARFKDPRTGQWTRIEHWRTAEQQGRIAARNMADEEVPYDSVPFFWTNQAGLNFQYVGHAENWDDVIIDGSLEDKKFVAYFIKNNKVAAAAGNGRGKDMAAIEELMRKNEMPEPERLREADLDLVEMAG